MKINRKSVASFTVISCLILVSLVMTCFINSEIVFYSLTLILFLIIFKNNIMLFNKCKSLYLWIYLFLLIFRITILFYRIHDLNAYFPFKGLDSGYFHMIGSRIMMESNNIGELLLYKQGLFNKFVACIYYFFCINEYYMYFVDFLFSELIFYYTYKTAFLISDNKNISIIGAFIFYIYPISIEYATDFMREMAVEFTLIVSIYYYVKYIKLRKWKDIAIALIFAIILSAMHSGYIGTIFCYLFAIAFFNNKKFRFKITPLRLITFSIILVALLVSPIWESVASKFQGLNSISDTVQYIANSQLGNSVYLIPPKTLTSAFLQLPIRFLYYLNAPLPWHIYSFETFVAMLADAIPRWYIFYCMIRTFLSRKSLSKIDKSILSLLLLVEFAVTFTFCWGTNNYGTAMRHRAASLPIEIMIFYVLRKRVKMNS